MKSLLIYVFLSLSLCLSACGGGSTGSAFEAEKDEKQVINRQINNDIVTQIKSQNDLGELVYEEISTADFLESYFIYSAHISSTDFMLSEPQIFTIPDNTISFSLNFHNPTAKQDLFIGSLTNPHGDNIPLNDLFPCFNGTCSVVLPNKPDSVFSPIPGEWQYQVLVEKNALQAGQIRKTKVNMLLRVSEQRYQAPFHYVNGVGPERSELEQGIVCEQGKESTDEENTDTSIESDSSETAEGNIEQTCTYVNPVAELRQTPLDFSSAIDQALDITAILPIQAYYTGSKNNHSLVEQIMNNIVKILLINQIGTEWNAPIHIDREQFSTVMPNFLDRNTQSLVSHGGSDVINIFFIENFEIFELLDRTTLHPAMPDELAFLLGVASGIPGPLGTEGSANGVLVSLVMGENQQALRPAAATAKVAVHEVGHFLGLYHTNSDGLPDTPKCELEQDQLTLPNASECPDGFNIMFPYTRGDGQVGIWLTPDQRYVLSHSPLAKGK